MSAVEITYTSIIGTITTTTFVGCISFPSTESWGSQNIYYNGSTLSLSALTGADWYARAIPVTSQQTNATTIPASPGSTFSGAQSAPTGSTLVTSSITLPTSPQHRLTAGDEVGIGVAAGVSGVLVIGALIWLLLLRRKKSKQAENTRYEKAELHGDSLERHKVVSELQENVVHELPDTNELREIAP